MIAKISKFTVHNSNDTDLYTFGLRCKFANGTWRLWNALKK